VPFSRYNDFRQLTGNLLTVRPTTNLCDWYLRFALKTAAPLGQARASAKSISGASSQQGLVSLIFDP
jgi:hypothetical protein